MPSSVVFAALVLAWLVVLVPVVARRRQMVPRPAEADLSAKVLPRGAAGAVMEKVSVEEVLVADAHPVGRGAAVGSSGSTAVMDRRGGATAVAERDDAPDVDRELDRELELDAHDGADLDGGPLDDADPDARPSGSRERVLDRRADHGADAEYDGGYDGGYDGEDVDDLDDLDDDLQPRSYRPGRGGFDPEAAEVAAHARYAFRQRVALGLIAVAVLSALAALVVTPVLWWLHVVTDLGLVGYLIFLRRQTRIEEEVRARRAARMSGERRALEARRERQAAHDDLMASHRLGSDEWDGWSDGDADDRAGGGVGHADEDGYAGEEPEPIEEPAPRWAAPRTPAPPVPDGMELVDDSHDDPAFHDLDGRDRMPTYRRAAGA